MRQLALLRSSFFILLMLGPLCFGAMEPWSMLLIELGVVAIFIAWALLCWNEIRIHVDVPTSSLLVFGALAAAQLFAHTTAYTYATQQELLLVCSYFLFFFLARHLLHSHEARERMAAIFTGFGGTLALFAIVQHFQGNRKIYWLRETATQSFFGPYANKNHYAGLLEMLIPFALFGAINAKRENAKRILSAFCAAVMIASVALSGSRTGTVVVMFEIILCAGLILFASQGRRRLIATTLTSIIALFFVCWIAGDALVHQSAFLLDPVGDASLVNRSQIARDSLELIKQHSVVGWGLGTFPIVYPQAASWYTDSLVNAAHDDYLQLLVETGVVGLGLILAFVSLVFRAGLKRLRLLPTSITAAALLGCSGLLLHSFTDFNIHVPANAAMFFSLCGMICAAEGTARQRASALPLRVETSGPVRGRRSRLPGIVPARPPATSTRSRFRWPTT